MEVVPLLWIGGLYATTPLKHRDPTSSNWKLLLSEAGFEITESIDDAEILVVVDIKESEMKRVRKARSEDKTLVLIRHEPIEVLPSNYMFKHVSLFDSVIDCGADPNRSPLSILRPQFWPSRDIEDSVDRCHQRIVILNSNQLGLIKGELYSLRRRCIYELPQVDLYGRSWNISTSKKVIELCYRITQLFKYRKMLHIASVRYWFKKPIYLVMSPDEKIDVMSRYKYALVIENSMDYMTEKLFDAFFAGCIPIYVGPPAVNFGIPEDLFIQALPNLIDIDRSIELAFEMNYSMWNKRMTKWINDSDLRHKWSMENSVKQFQIHIQSVIQKSNKSDVA